MTKLYIACAMLLPIIGCSGVATDDSSAFGGHEAGSASSGRGGAPASTSAGAVNGSAGASTLAGSGGCSVEALPAALQTMITNKCSACHGTAPLSGLPSLVTYANLIAPAKGDPNKTNAVVALARLQSATTPMPPSPGTPASATEIAVLQDFISQGYPKPSCPSAGGSGGGGSAGGGNADPLNVLPTCTSMTTWNNGNKGSALMNPGMPCISCHKSEGEGPSFGVAGTIYPTGHEPDRCNSSIGTAGARVVIIGADGQMTTLTPNAAGNFSSKTAVKTPYQAKVTYQGRERLMLTPQSSGDCNSCHTQNGSMMAPGRITVP